MADETTPAADTPETPPAEEKKGPVFLVLLQHSICETPTIDVEAKDAAEAAFKTSYAYAGSIVTVIGQKFTADEKLPALEDGSYAVAVTDKTGAKIVVVAEADTPQDAAVKVSTAFRQGTVKVRVLPPAKA